MNYSFRYLEINGSVDLKSMWHLSKLAFISFGEFLSFFSMLRNESHKNILNESGHKIDPCGATETISSQRL